MKIILMHDIAKVGRKYDVADVADGHALNHLIPQGKAVPATAIAQKRIALLKKGETEKRAISDTLLSKELKALEGVTIELSHRANDKGHLFAAIHESEIAAAIEKKTKLAVKAEHIVIEKPIKEVGEFKVGVAVSEKKASVAVTITAIKE